MKEKILVLLLICIGILNAQFHSDMNTKNYGSITGSYISFEDRNSYNTKLTLYHNFFKASLGLTKIENDYINALKRNKFENTNIATTSIGFITPEINKNFPFSLSFISSLSLSADIFIPSYRIQSFLKIKILNNFIYPSLGFNHTLSSHPTYSKYISSGYFDSFDLYHENRNGKNTCGFVCLYIPIHIKEAIFSVNFSRILEKESNLQIGVSYFIKNDE